MIKNLINIITAPQAAFDSLEQKPSALLPLLLIIVISGAVQYLYYLNMSPDYLIDQTVEQISNLGITAISESDIRESMEGTNPKTSGISTIISIAIFLPIVFSAIAGYLTFLSKFSNQSIPFKRWFSLTVWASVVTVFSAVAAIVVIFTAADPGRIPTEQLQALSLNNLLFQTQGSFNALLSSLSLPQLWTLTLIILGYKSWTGKSLLSSTLAVSIPYLLIYGTWALIIIL